MKKPIVYIAVSLLFVLFLCLFENGITINDAKIPDKSRAQITRVLKKYGAENIEPMDNPGNLGLPYITFDMTYGELLRFYVSQPEYRKAIM